MNFRIGGGTAAITTPPFHHHRDYSTSRIAQFLSCYHEDTQRTGRSKSLHRPKHVIVRYLTYMLSSSAIVGTVDGEYGDSVSHQSISAAAGRVAHPGASCRNIQARIVRESNMSFVRLLWSSVSTVWDITTINYGN